MSTWRLFFGRLRAMHTDALSEHKNVNLVVGKTDPEETRTLDLRRDRAAL